MRFEAVRITTSALAPLRRFYTAVLGLPLARDESDRFSVRAGATELELRRAPAAARPRHHLAFNVPPERLADGVAWLRRRVAVLEPGGDPIVPFPHWNAHAAYFRDPAGNVLELIARHDLPAGDDPRPFGPASLQRVSEVGLPVPRVDEAVDALARLGLPRYSGDRRSFAAIGDVHGLLIVVPAGRAWFPTADVCGAVHPVELTLAEPGPWADLPHLGLRVRRR